MAKKVWLKSNKKKSIKMKSKKINYHKQKKIQLKEL
jgi:hypothetical protein